MSSPYLTTAEAAGYLRFASTSGIRSAVRRGELRPAGTGPRGTHLFTRDELDAFIAGRARRRIARNAARTTTREDRSHEHPEHRSRADLANGPASQPASRPARDDTSHASASRRYARPPRASAQVAGPGGQRSQPAGKSWGIRELLDRAHGEPAIASHG